MSFNFPNSPSVGEGYAPVGGPLFTWDGVAWKGVNQGIPVPARNYVINGDFQVWQRATTGATGFIADRWYLNPGAGSTNTFSRGTLGVGVMPYADRYFASWQRSVAGSATSSLTNKIEDVATLAGKTVTVTLWASAIAATEIYVQLTQSFGTGGSPSASVSVGPTTVPISTTMTKYAVTFALPSIAGKTLGTTLGTDSLWLAIGRPQASPNPTTTVNISHVSLTEGDQTAVADVFEPRSQAEELALCLRYFQKITAYLDFFVVSASQYLSHTLTFPSMRAAPALTITTAGTVTNASSSVTDGATVSSLRFGLVATAPGLVSVYGRVISLDAEVP